jgi:hypothetical protein
MTHPNRARPSALALQPGLARATGSLPRDRPLDPSACRRPTPGVRRSRRAIAARQPRARRREADTGHHRATRAASEPERSSTNMRAKHSPDLIRRRATSAPAAALSPRPPIEAYELRGYWCVTLQLLGSGEHRSIRLSWLEMPAAWCRRVNHSKGLGSVRADRHPCRIAAKAR